MASDYHIHLNFLPAERNLPNCLLYRRQCISPQEERPFPEAMAYKLPVSPGDQKNWQRFWVSPDERSDFEVYEFCPALNSDLARRMIFRGLKIAVQAALPAEQYWLPESEFIEEVSLSMRSHAEGEELLVIQSYSLRAQERLGFLVDFHFRLRGGVQFSRKVQQLSLSLDRNFRRNIDYYVDRSTKVRQFLEERWLVFEAIKMPGSAEPLRISREFVALSAERLSSKVYIFGDGKESRSQFAGLREFGPLKPLERPPKLLFAFREQDRLAARMLAISLRGLKQRGQFTFPGFKALFKSDLEIDGNPIILPDLQLDTMSLALDRVKAERQSSSQILPILVLPEGDDNGYLAQKAIFSHSGFPTQVCTLKILKDEESLKWAIANLALQIFCKAGGQPWKVRPTAERSLIIGISQSHKTKIVGDRRHVERYFAFSVLTDSSGLFQQIRVLGDADNHSAYISTVRANLRKVLEDSAENFDRVVIHTSFKLKHQEMDAIQGTVREVAARTEGSQCRFAVIKVNHKNRFFGINRSVNSLVPFEGTKVKLGHHEYLVWFEGIHPDKPNVTKAFPGPTHLQFLRIGDERIDPAEERELLQDLLNLSGANWRGFNAKSAPVSIFYCNLVADLVHDFHEQRLPMPAMQDLRPWFL